MNITASQFGISLVNIRKSSFLWQISNFTHLKRKFGSTISENQNGSLSVKDVIESPTFSASSEDFKWRLVMFCLKFNTYTNDINKICFEFRSKDSRCSIPVDVIFSVALLKKNGDFSFKRENNTFIQYFENTSSSFHLRSMTGRGFLLHFISIDSLFEPSNGYLKDDELYILCEYKVISDHESNQTITLNSQDLKNRVKILETLEKQWDEQKYCDFELVAPCGRKLYAHKFILSARSPVFSVMLTSDMKEKHENSVKIENIRYEALEEILRFMYSGKVKKLNHEIVSDVLFAADYYQISHLKDVCKEFLLKKLNIENAELTFKLCKAYCIADLQPIVNSFVKSNAKIIFFSSGLQKLDDETDDFVKIVQAKFSD